jgi:hypothetical protein
MALRICELPGFCYTFPILGVNNDTDMHCALLMAIQAHKLTRCEQSEYEVTNDTFRGPIGSLDLGHQAFTLLGAC